MKPRLTDADFARAAAELGCTVAAVRAVVRVESPRGGFNPDGTLTTLFEAHHFHRYTRGRFAQSHPRLSSPSWNRALYASTWGGERARLAEAMALDRTAALLSTSFGMFQIMGFNFSTAGHSSVGGMVDAFDTGEGPQLDAFVDIIRAWGLDDEMRTLHLPASQRAFALRYNGPRAEENGYPAKIGAAFAHFSRAVA